MRTVAERWVCAGAAPESERLWGLKDIGVTTCCREQEHNALSSLDAVPAKLDFSTCLPGCDLRGPVCTQDLLHESWDQVRIFHELDSEVGTPSELQEE